MGQRSFFEVLGIKPAFHLSKEELEERYLSLSKRVHPDRFAKAPPEERRLALQRTTELNDAYRVLKHELKRAEYLLKLEGIDLGDERAGGQRAADPALLFEVMELREALSEALAEKNRAAVASLSETVRQKQRAALAEVDHGFERYEAGDRSTLPAIAAALVALRYYARFVDEVAAHEEARE